MVFSGGKACGRLRGKKNKPPNTTAYLYYLSTFSVFPNLSFGMQKQYNKLKRYWWIYFILQFKTVTQLDNLSESYVIKHIKINIILTE